MSVLILKKSPERWLIKGIVSDIKDIGKVIQKEGLGAPMINGEVYIAEADIRKITIDFVKGGFAYEAPSRFEYTPKKEVFKEEEAPG